MSLTAQVLIVNIDTRFDLLASSSFTYCIRLVPNSEHNIRSDFLVLHLANYLSFLPVQRLVRRRCQNLITVPLPFLVR